MSNRRVHKRNLSKGILEMKFMKRSKEKADKEKLDLDSANLFSHNVLKGLKSSGTEFVIEHSMVPIEKLLNGRMSFKGMNLEVERLMEQERREIKVEAEELDRLKSNRPEVSDVEMAKRLGKSVAKNNGRVNDKRGGNNSDKNDSDETDISPSKRRKFLKPADD